MRKGNARITVEYDGDRLSFTSEGLSETVQSDGSAHRYLSNAERQFIEQKIEELLIILSSDEYDEHGYPLDEEDEDDL